MTIGEAVELYANRPSIPASCSTKGIARGPIGLGSGRVRWADKYTQRTTTNTKARPRLSLCM